VLQLLDVRVQKMAQLLESKNSSFSPTFKNVFRDTVAGTGVHFPWTLMVMCDFSAFDFMCCFKKTLWSNNHA
jgi:hypothetical protein